MKSKGFNHDLDLKTFCDACSHGSVLFGCLGIAFKFAELEYSIVLIALLVTNEMATPMVEDNFQDDHISSMTTEDIIRASHLLNNEMRVLKEEFQRTNLELDSFREKIKENHEKIKLNKQLPYLVGNIVEILVMNPEEEAEEDGENIDLDSQRKGKCVVIKKSTRQYMEAWHISFNTIQGKYALVWPQYAGCWGPKWSGIWWLS